MRVHVRRVRPEDDVALMKLYEWLDLDDRVSRFSSAYRPRFGISRDLATVEERGDDADVIVVSHRCGDAARHRVMNGHASLHPRVPVFVDAPHSHDRAAG
jgi:hypothetical protein